ncbi:MAG: TlpA family protein disulfide reductase [Deltaproteobacteria bacterium]|nr:TlpA family protein disulfide reductase [Deltaproteobacteria bacterium]
MRIKLLSVLSLFVVAILWGGGAFLGEGAPVREHPSCEPQEAAREFVEELDIHYEGCHPRQPCWQEILTRAESILASFPDEIHLHRPYLQYLYGASKSGQPDRFEAALAAYGDRASREKGNPAAQYLYAYVLDAEEELKAYERALEAEEDYPWGHWGLAYAYGRTSPESGRARNEEKAKAHLEAFLVACPNRFREPLLLRTQITDQAFWRRYLPVLREQIAGASPRQRALALPGLWQLEFRLAPVAEHEGLRQRLRGELERFENAHPPTDRHWAYALERTHKVAGNPAASRRLREQRQAQNPCSSEAVEALLNGFAQGMGSPQEAGERLVFASDSLARRLYRESSGWIARCPGSWQLHLARFQAAVNLQDLPDDALLREVEAMLGAWEPFRASIRMRDSPYVHAARALLNRQLKVERVQPLLEQERALIPSSREKAAVSSSGGDERSQIPVGRTLKLVQLELLESEAAFRLGELEGANEALREAAEKLESIESPDSRQAGQMEVSWARYWQLRGQVASKAGRKLDAMAFLRKVPPDLLDTDLLGGSATNLPSLESGASMPTEAQWREMGGSEDGWRALEPGLLPAGGEAATAAIRGAAQSDWDSRRDTLLDFRLVDLQGKAWKPADLLGKVTLINTWATWCPPCRLELPFVQELHVGLARRPDFQVISLNVDSNPGEVAPFVEEYRLSFPVLLGESYFKSLKVSRAVPQSWIVDPQGVIRRGQSGFLPREGPGWAAEALLQMEEVRAVYGSTAH